MYGASLLCVWMARITDRSRCSTGPNLVQHQGLVVTMGRHPGPSPQSSRGNKLSIASRSRTANDNILGLCKGTRRSNHRQAMPVRASHVASPRLDNDAKTSSDSLKPSSPGHAGPSINSAEGHLAMEPSSSSKLILTPPFRIAEARVASNRDIPKLLTWG